MAEVGGVQPCPECRTAVRDDTLVCPACGTTIRAAVGERLREPPPRVEVLVEWGTPKPHRGLLGSCLGASFGALVLGMGRHLIDGDAKLVWGVVPSLVVTFALLALQPKRVVRTDTGGQTRRRPGFAEQVQMSTNFGASRSSTTEHGSLGSRSLVLGGLSAGVVIPIVLLATPLTGDQVVPALIAQSLAWVALVVAFVRLLLREHEKNTMIRTTVPATEP